MFAVYSITYQSKFNLSTWDSFSAFLYRRLIFILFKQFYFPAMNMNQLLKTFMKIHQFNEICFTI